MDTLKISANIIKCVHSELNLEEKEWIKAACDATYRSYSPYSGFRVGAAMVLEGSIVLTGSNQENAAYPSGMCAERTVLFYANSLHPDLRVEALIVAAADGDGFTDNPVSPCGSCRQVLLECEVRFGYPVRVYLYGKSGIYIISSARDLLPLAFDSF
ncbi:MAG: cytidine deaminase [Dysgonamonadaceae bacterium]|jgi:cytidine deaminase|nr:cytidine deaminase [Dysgonamonadaceae bacterium]